MEVPLAVAATTLGTSVAQMWLAEAASSDAAAVVAADATCGILEGYFYYTWGKNRPNNSAGQGYAKTTAECCDLCANHTGCEAFSFYTKGAATGDGICRLHTIPLPAIVPVSNPGLPAPVCRSCIGQNDDRWVDGGV